MVEQEKQSSTGYVVIRRISRDYAIPVRRLEEFRAAEGIHVEIGDGEFYSIPQDRLDEFRMSLEEIRQLMASGQVEMFDDQDSMDDPRWSRHLSVGPRWSGMQPGMMGGPGMMGRMAGPRWSGHGGVGPRWSGFASHPDQVFY